MPGRVQFQGLPSVQLQPVSCHRRGLFPAAADTRFIRTDTWEAMEKHRREVQASHRQEQNEFVKSDEQLEADIAKDKAQWFATWPTGTRYEVRCLDGGAWDRSTGWGMVGSLEEAIDICKNGPSWRH